MQHLGISIVFVLIVTGCNSSDERLSSLVRETNAQQAQQNQQLTQLNQEAAENHRRVVETVEQSRQEIVQLERDLHQQRERLDGERRELANERYRETLLAPVLNTLGLLLVAGLPLILCWCLLRGMYQTDDVISTVLVQELVAQNTTNLPAASSRPALAPPDDQLPAQSEPKPS